MVYRIKPSDNIAREKHVQKSAFIRGIGFFDFSYLRSNLGIIHKFHIIMIPIYKHRVDSNSDIEDKNDKESTLNEHMKVIDLIKKKEIVYSVSSHQINLTTLYYYTSSLTTVSQKQF